MRAQYDFSKGIRNPYAKQLKKQLTIRIDSETLTYFQSLSDEIGIPYQTLMNMYLRECAEMKARPHWVASTGRRANSRQQRTPAARKRAASRR